MFAILLGMHTCCIRHVMQISIRCLLLVFVLETSTTLARNQMLQNEQRQAWKNTPKSPNPSRPASILSYPILSYPILSLLRVRSRFASFTHLFLAINNQVTYPARYFSQVSLNRISLCRISTQPRTLSCSRWLMPWFMYGSSIEFSGHHS